MNAYSFPEFSALPADTAQQLRQLITVHCTEGSHAQLSFFEQADSGWTLRLRCDAYIGRMGAGKTREGDMKTPLGLFYLSMPFGILTDPSADDPLRRTATKYLQINENHYWCGQDGPYYNRLIDASVPPPCWLPSPADEHMCDFAPSYHYGMFIEYNREGKSGLGSAIFLHCTGRRPYTAGCVAVEEKFMRELILSLKEGAAILIFE